MTLPSRTVWPFALIAMVVLIADQLTKYAVEQLTPSGSLRILIPGLLNLVHTNNPGVAFGILSSTQTPWRAPVLIIFSLGVMCLIMWLVATDRAGSWLGQYGLVLILGGAAGNFLDRILRRSVTDFIDFHIGDHHWYTFNVADSAIVVGAGLVILELLRDWRHPTHERA
ncbi:MAG TPA: signal peptidase II [Candidatus Acidoferrales bacterium]|nr:signal peptidase II [Candidatus Acidoferrales bacterium]